MGKNLVTHLRAITHQEATAIHVKDANEQFRPVIFSQLWKTVDIVASALLAMGIKKGTMVGIISENRPEWLYADLAILSLGACDVPRGADCLSDEMHYILEHSDVRVCFVETAAQCETVLANPPSQLTQIILFDDYPEITDRPKQKKIKISTFKDLLVPDIARASAEELLEAQNSVDIDDLATIIYTTGTTGVPKGAMLTHRNILFELQRLGELSLITENSIVLAILPIWHSFERVANYLTLHCNASLAHSKPIARNILQDMAAVKPQVMASVPRIWEGIRSAIYRNIAKQSPVKIAMFHFFVAVGIAFARLKNIFMGNTPSFRRRFRAGDCIATIIPLAILSPLYALGNVLLFSKLKQRLGGKFMHGVSGGASLAKNVSEFFQGVGLKIYEGYGMTEASPVIAVSYPKKVVYDSVGYFLRDIEYRILDETGNKVPRGKMGTLHIKSEQIMQGYYKQPDLTKTMIDDEGWLNTGDLVRQTYQGAIKIIGRSKDTIVLLSGENVEPEPIEEMICSSWHIDNAMILGDEKKFLVALVVPNEDNMMELAKKLHITYSNFAEFSQRKEVKDLLFKEIQQLIQTRNGFRDIERIARIAVLPKQFEIDVEISKTMKLKRFEVKRLYKKEIEDLFTV